MGMFSFVYLHLNQNLEAADGTVSLYTKDAASASKFVLGTYNGNDVVFQAIKDNVDGGLLAMSPYGVRRTTLCKSNCIGSNVAYVDTTLYEVETAINNSIRSNTLAKSIIVREVFNPSVSEIFTGGNVGAGFNGSLQLSTKYLSSDIQIMDCSISSPRICDTGLPCNDVCTFDGVWTKQSIYTIPSVLGDSYAPIYSVRNPSAVSWHYWGVRNGTIDYVAAVIRPAVIINKNKIAFALSTAIKGNALTKINVLPPTETLKLRVKDNAISAITITNSVTTQSFEKGDKIKINFSGAVLGKHVTALLFNSANQIAYYQDFGTPSNGTIEIDTSSFNAGDVFDIKLVNETVTSDNQPTSVSSFSNSFKATINAPHKLSYTATPQSGASSGKEYEFSKNVDEGQIIGKVTANPLGVTPLVYELIGNGDDTYKNFEIDGLDANNASSNTPLNVKIKSGAPDLVNGGLKAGSYKFCITAVDDNGYPVDKSGNPTEKVCTSFTVEKTKPEITFDQNDKGTTYVSGDTTNTTTHSEHAAHTNGDSTNTDVDIEYSFVSGSSNIIVSGLPFTSQNAGDNADIVFAANASGSIVIQAKIPESDNYEAATTTKTITLQLGVVANYVETKTNIKAGSTEAKPPTSYTSGSRIGYVDVSGGVTPYTYSLPSGKGHNGSFYIDNSGNVYVNKGVGTNGLTPGDYDIEIEVKDNTSPTKMTAVVKKTITVSAATLEGVGWEDPSNPGKALASNVYEVTYDPSGEPNNGGTFNTRLMETTSGTLSGTVIKYTLDPDPNDVLSISGSSTIQATVKKASDTATKNKVKIKAHITGGIYGTTGVDSELIVNVKKYPQTIAFQDTSILKLPVGGACTAVTANITSTYSKSGETIQYTSSNTSSNAPFAINAKGEVCPTSNASDAGSATLTGTLAGDDNYEEATTKTGRVIQVYVPGNIEVTGSIENGGTTGVTYTPDKVLKKALYTSANANGGTAKKDVAVAQVSVRGST